MALSQETLTRLNNFKQSDKYNNLSSTTKSRLDVFLNKNTDTPIQTDSSLQPDTFSKAKAIGGTVLGAGALFAGGKKLSEAKIPSNARRLFLTQVAGYSKPTVETVEKVGFKPIQNIQKQGLDTYISNVIPEVKDKIIDYFTNKTVDSKVLEDLGFNTDDIKEISSIPKDRINIIKKLKSKSATETLAQIGKTKAEAGSIIGRAEKLAKQIDIPDYIPKTYKVIRGELNRLGYLKGDAIAQDISAVKDKALQGLLKEWVNIKGDPYYAFSVSDVQKLRTNLESSLGGEAKFDRIVYKVLDTLRDEHLSNIDRYDIPAIKKLDVRKALKDYSDSIKLENVSNKIKDVIEKEPGKFVERFKGSIMDIFKEPTRQRYKALFGEKLYNKLKTAVATSEIYPLKESNSGLWKMGIRGASKGLFRTMKGTATKGMNVVTPGLIIMDAMKFKQDPEAYQIAQETGQDYWKVKENLALKGSQERKIQLGQVL